MCGIVGIIDIKQNREINRDLLNKMNESQLHRGPDEGGLHLEPGVGLGHRRLSIIDLKSGQQPLYNEDKSVVVVYNGEIYNFVELADELKTHGHTFRTHCDTEVIVHAWEQWGRACVDKFRGMFAFAIWDRNKREFFMARDRLGIKPIYYAQLNSGYFIFSSELKALMCHPDLSKQMDHKAIEDYFAFGYIPEPRTIFAQAQKLLPGHSLLLERGKKIEEQKQYWDVPFAVQDYNDEREIQQELIERLTEAVKIRMIAEVPLGAFLSGGVDSSAVVAMMAKLSPNESVNTCSIGFGDPKFNETEFATMVANKFNTHHYLEQVDAEDFDLIDKLVELYDEPYADSSAIPTYRVCQLARKHVTVALSGDGGDENIAGYRRHRWHMNEEKIRSIIPGFIRRPLFGIAGSLYPKIDWAPKLFRAKSTLQAIARDSSEAYLHSISVMHDGMRKELFSNSMRKTLDGYTANEVFRHYANRAPTDDPLSLIQYLDLKTYLPGDILTKVDRASMAHSLEVRVPILDHPFVEWMSSVPSHLKLRGQQGKYIFKKSLENILPHDILYRPKMGFGVPLSNWFRGPLKERVRISLLGDHLRNTELFNMDYIAKLVNDHQAGVRENSSAIWSLLMFEAFIRRIEP